MGKSKREFFEGEPAYPASRAAIRGGRRLNSRMKGILTLEWQRARGTKKRPAVFRLQLKKTSPTDTSPTVPVDDIELKAKVQVNP